MTLQKVLKTFTFSFSRGCVLPQLLVPRLAAEFNSIGIRGELRGEHLTMLLPYFIFIYCILYTLYHTTMKYNKKRHKPTIPEPYHTKHFLHTVRANVLCLAVPQETIVQEKCNSNRSKLCNSIPCQPGGFSTTPHYHIGEGLQRRTLW